MDIYYYVLLWSGFAGCIAWTPLTEKEKKILYLLAVFVPMICICGLRSTSVGIDTPMYHLLIQDAFNDTFEDFFSYDGYQKKLDIGWFLLTKLIQIFSEDTQVVIFVAALISLSGFAIYIYIYSRNVYMSTVLFIMLGYWLQHFNLMRQFMSIMILAFAYESLIDDKRRRFILLVGVAFLFHMSALIYVPLVAFYKSKFQHMKIVMLVAIFSFFLAISFPVQQVISLLPPAVSFYLNTLFATPKTSLLIAVKCMFIYAFLLFSVYKFYLTRSTSYKDYRLICYYAIPLLLACFFSMAQYQLMIFYRLVDMFQFYLIIIIPMVLSKVKIYQSDVFLRYVLNVFFFILGLCYFTRTMDILSEAGSIYYSSCF